MLFTIHYGEIKTSFAGYTQYPNNDLQSTMVRLRQPFLTEKTYSLLIYNPLW